MFHFLPWSVLHRESVRAKVALALSLPCRNTTTTDAVLTTASFWPLITSENLGDYFSLKISSHYKKYLFLQESLADESFSTSDGAAGPSSLSSSPSRAMLDRPTQLVRIVTSDFPQYFAVITRARQDISTVGAEGGTISSTLCPRAKVHIPQK